MGMAAAQLLQLSHTVASTDVPTNPEPAVTPFYSRVVGDSMGARINAQITAAGSPYVGNFTTLRDRLLSIGIYHVRENTIVGSGTGATAQQNCWAILGAAGIGVDSRLGDGKPGDDSVSAYTVQVKTNIASGVVYDAIEGSQNEWDGKNNVDSNGVNPNVGTGTSPITGIAYSATYPLWCEQMVVRQRAFWNAFKADSVLQNIPFYTGTQVGATATGGSLHLKYVADAVYGTSVGMANYTDFGNYHIYPGTAAGGNPPTRNPTTQPSTPSYQLASRSAAMPNYAPGKPFVCTETGYNNALNNTGGISPHSETAAGIYWPRTPLEHIYRGAKRVYAFEAVDDWTNASGDTHLTDQETSFGLFRHDWTAKPGATALGRLLGAFSDTTSTFTLTPLNYSIAAGTDVRSMLFQHSSGKYLIAMWRDVSVWNYVTKTDVTVTATTATVTFQNPVNLRLLRPTASGTYSTVGTNATTVALSMTGDVQILEVTASAAVIATAAATIAANAGLTATGTTPVAAVKRNYGGVMTNSNTDRQRFTPDLDQYWAKVPWKSVQPTNGSSYTWSAIDQYLDGSYGSNIKLHIGAGTGDETNPDNCDAPTWLSNIVGTISVVNTQGGNTLPTYCPVYWDNRYITAFNNFVAALGARYDNQATLGTVAKISVINCFAASLWYDEPWIMGGHDASNIRMYNGTLAGRTGQPTGTSTAGGLNLTVLQSVVDNALAALRAAFPTTVIEMPAHDSQLTYPTSTGQGGSWTTGRDWLNSQHTLYGQHICITDYGFGPTDSGVVAQNRATATALYPWMKQRANEGYPVGLQTTGTTDASTWGQAAQNGVDLGASWIEHSSTMGYTPLSAVNAWDTSYKANVPA